ncbi:MAG: aspartate aminotransferase family protein [Nitrospirae bacterium]|nr:aspartate aminotransferase family protein [Nitrospirota bacterium]MCL5979017.1 aspartate aminotransferase family protein [Nitrospirota bacterium]
MRDIIKKANELLTPALVMHNDITVKRAKGIYVEDVKGKRYMDFTSGIAVANTGHNHPKVVEAIKKQADALIHSGCIFYYEAVVKLSEMLKDITPPGIDMFFFGNSGTEAVEGALKLARFYTGRQGIVAFTGCFHGRTLGSLSLTSSGTRYRRKYHSLLPSVYHSPYPYCYRCFFNQKPETCGMDCYEYMERLFKHLLSPEETACIIIEPVLGEGGYVVPPMNFLKRLRKFCDKWGILLILDEVQSGMGRTGKWFASEHFSVIPDIMTIAKGIASGMPLSVIAAKKEMMSRWSPGAHGTTFGGNPVSCAAATATIEVIKEEGLLKNAAVVSKYAMKMLNKMKEKYDSIGDVRGLGLMIGIELVKKGKPYTDGIKKIMAHCLKNGLILVEAGVDKNVIRLAPPLIVTKEEIEKGLKIFENALKKAG